MNHGKLSLAGKSGEEQAAEAIDYSLDEQHAKRIRRIGKKLLRVANCLISFGKVAEKMPDKDRSMASIEAQFSDSLPLSGIPEFVPDARTDRFLATHKLVAGAPYIRFYASHPILNEDGEVVGNIRLLDYSPRVLGDEEKLLLSDLAAFAERELRLISMIATRQDLLKKNWSLRRDSMIDPDVGTWNRTAITRLLKQEVEQCRKDDKPLSLVLADLDAFKKINEVHGRTAGDNLLVKVVSRLRSCIRPHDTLGRYEGGRFLIILPGADNMIAKLVAERLQNAIKSNPETIGDTTVAVTISSGTVSTDKFASADSDELVSLVNAALSSAQKLGHNSIAQAVSNEVKSSPVAEKVPPAVVKASPSAARSSAKPFPTITDI